MRSGKGVSSMNGRKRVKKTCLWLALLASRNPDVSNLGLDVYFMAPPPRLRTDLIPVQKLGQKGGITAKRLIRLN